MKNIALILAAGKSERFGKDKLWDERLGMPVLYQTINKFQQCPDVHEIILVSNVRKETEIQIKKMFPKVRDIFSGGETRSQSLRQGIKSMNDLYSENVRILVHNGANPFVQKEEISAALDKAKQYKNIVFGFFTPNAVKKVQHGKIQKALPREEIFECQTPQISDLHTFTKALDQSGGEFSDEAELLMRFGEEVFVYECSPENKKITFSSDFPDRYRIGFGEDSHRFAETFDAKSPLTLGGVPLPESQLSMEANSDGDVIFHALCNAILSSIGEKTFDFIAAPLCEQGEKNSQIYLRETLATVRKKFPSWKIHNILISLEGKKPSLEPSHDILQDSICHVLNLEKCQVGLTYTSGENLSDFGKGLGLGCRVFLFATL